jgi:uncharacterized repeat protein (TIGR03803 family)
MQVRAQTETVLYTFTGSSDGGVPYAGLISDKDGNLYGTASEYGDGLCNFPFIGCGAVFELARGDDQGTIQWTFKLLYTFQGGSDGANPNGDLAFDSLGNLYGTTAWGGTGCAGSGCGTVFELERSGDQWVEKVLYRFTGGPDGQEPLSSLTLDSQGNIYGTAAYGGDNNCINGFGTGCGVVFRLSPTGASTENTRALTVLHTFHGDDGANPYVGVTLAPLKLCGSPEHATAGGNGKVCIFGTATNGAYTDIEPGGVVFQISTGVRAWNYKMLYEFPGGCGGPGGPLLLDKSGTLYGMTHLGGQYCSGSVFTLSKNSHTGVWSETDIYSFAGPQGWFPVYQGTVMDEHGNLYGTTSAGGTSSNCQAGCGTVFRLSKATGSGGWYESGLYSLQGGADGWGPLAGNVVVNSTGVYGMTPSGGNPNCLGLNQPGCGVIYRIGP